MSGTTQPARGRAHILAGRGKVAPEGAAPLAFPHPVRMLSGPRRDAYLDDAGVML